MRKLPVLTFFAISRLSDIQSEKFFQILYWRFLRIVKHIFEFIKRNFRYPLFLTLWWPLWPWETKCSIFAAVYLPRIHCRHIIQQLYATKFVVQDKTRFRPLLPDYFLLHCIRLLSVTFNIKRYIFMRKKQYRL